MNQRTACFWALNLTCAMLNPVYAQTEPGLQGIREVAQINGQALACQQLKLAAHAKNLMLMYAPKTAGFGTVINEGTQQAFLAQTSSVSPCPDEAVMAAQLRSLELKLQASLPIAAPLTPTSGTR